MSMLLSKANIASLDLKNRVVMSPMRTYNVQKEDGVLNPLHFAHYGARAVEQVGLVVIEVTAVEPDGRTTANDLGLWNQKQADELKRLVDFLHSLGTKVGIQLGHAGRKAKDAKNVVAPSKTTPYNSEYLTPKALDKETIHKIQEAFVNAAHYANEAGVDMIELQGAEGFLLEEFLSSKLNHRNDEYGGMLKDRYRFIKEIVQKIRGFYDGSFWVRLSLDDHIKENETKKLLESKQLGQWLEEDGIDCISVTTGGLVDNKPTSVYEGWQVPYAEAMKEAVSIPVAVVGRLLDPKLCEYILKRDKADLILEAHVFDQNARWVVDSAKELDEML